MLAPSRIIPLSIPEELYLRLEKVAQFTGAVISEIVLEASPWFYTRSSANPEASLASLSTLSPIQLWVIVYQRLTPQDEAHMAALMAKNQGGELSDSERQALDDYLGLLKLQMRLRSSALVQLQALGYDIEAYEG